MIGHTISHYKILEKLGEGGMGVVYKAEDLKLNRFVALKFLPPELTRDPEAKERFVYEARAASALDHSNICTIHEIDEVGGHAFIAMACIEGETLKKQIEVGPLKLDRAIDLAVQVAEGLQEAHEKGIVHRDIKPANIMVTPKGQAKIMDFGLAKLAGKTRLTRAGTTVGTAAYMSPEQTRGEDVDHRTDIWSLGVALYEMVTGQLPFKGDHEQALIYSLVNEGHPPVTSLRTGIPLGLEAIVDRCLEKRPSERSQTAGDLIADLRRARRALTEASAKSRLAVGSQRGTRPVRWWLWGAIAVVVVVAAGTFLRYFKKPAGEPISERKMLVVLPFENLGPSDDEYFANGITDAITARLAGLHGLGVISRQSAMQYKGSGKSTREIGEELGVEYILEGTVQRERPKDPTSRVRIIPQLIRVMDDTHMWADTYDEEMSEVFRVQSNVAEQVASELEVTLLQSERRALEEKPTENLEAYEYYLRGNHYFAPRIADEDLEDAIKMYEKAVELDPEFAAAWAALSMAQVFLYWGFDRFDALPSARAASDQASRLDPDLPESHLARGYLYLYVSRDYAKALEHFEKAQALRPSDAETAFSIGLVLRRQGRWDEALESLGKAVKTDPRGSSIYECVLGDTYYIMRRYEEADRYMSRAISKAPDMLSYVTKANIHLIWDGDVKRAEQVLEEASRRVSPTAISDWLPNLVNIARVLTATHIDLLDRLRADPSMTDSPLDVGAFWLIKADLSAQRGEKDLATSFYDSARVALEAAVRARDESSDLTDSGYLIGYLGLAYAGLGRRQEALEEGQRAVALCPVSRDAVEGPVLLVILAEIYTRLGEYDQAIDQLEVVLSIPSEVSVPLLRIDPVWDPLRDHPRFQQLLEKHAGDAS